MYVSLVYTTYVHTFEDRSCHSKENDDRVSIIKVDADDMKRLVVGLWT